MAVNKVRNQAVQMETSAVGFPEQFPNSRSHFERCAEWPFLEEKATSICSFDIHQFGNGFMLRDYMVMHASPAGGETLSSAHFLYR